MGTAERRVGANIFGIAALVYRRAVGDGWAAKRDGVHTADSRRPQAERREPAFRVGCGPTVRFNADTTASQIADVVDRRLATRNGSSFGSYTYCLCFMLRVI